MKPNLDSEHLRTFLAVFQYASVTRAADNLHKTQSAVSIQLRRLEENLESQLFVRQARGVKPTLAGERLAAVAQRVVSELDRTAQSFRGNAVRGEVRVGIPEEYGSDMLPKVLAEFSLQHPGVEVFVRCGFSSGFVEAFELGELDVAVFSDHGEQTDGMLLTREPTLWVASPRLTIEARKPVPIAVFDRSCYWRDLVMDALHDANMPFEVVFTSESTAGVIAAITSGVAVGAIPGSTIQKNMKVLGPSHGFPLLPDSVLRLICKSPGAGAVDSMVGAIRKNFQLG